MASIAMVALQQVREMDGEAEDLQRGALGGFKRIENLTGIGIGI